LSSFLLSFCFLCGVNFATDGLYDDSFVHLIAGHNRNSGSIAALMPTFQQKPLPAFWLSFHWKRQFLGFENCRVRPFFWLCLNADLSCNISRQSEAGHSRRLGIRETILQSF